MKNAKTKETCEFYARIFLLSSSFRIHFMHNKSIYTVSVAVTVVAVVATSYCNCMVRVKMSVLGAR